MRASSPNPVQTPDQTATPTPSGDHAGQRLLVRVSPSLATRPSVRLTGAAEPSRRRTQMSKSPSHAYPRLATR
jgi:hypothetical protein